MKDELITFETAKLAKEKGCDLFKLDLGLNQFLNNEGITQSLLQKWLRKFHDIDVQPYPYSPDVWRFSITKINYSYTTLDGRNPEFKVQLSRDWSSDWDKYKTFEQAFEQGLYEALKSL